MAGIDSSNESGFSHTRSKSWSQPLHQKENIFFLKEPWDRSLLGGLSHGEYTPAKKLKQHNKSRASQESTSANIRRYPSPAAPSVSSLPPRPQTRAMGSASPFGSAVRPTTSLSLESTLPSARVDLEQQPSPRSKMRTFQAERPRILFSNQPGPMDRFLLQEDLLAGFGDDPDRMKEGQRLRSLRTNALRLRAQLKIKRKELREKQAVKISADEAFIKYVRENQPVQPSSSAQNSLDNPQDAYYAAMQNARDEYGPLEDEYTRTEDILDETEFEIAKIEIRLYGPELPPFQEDEATTLSQANDFLSPSPASSLFMGLSTGALDHYEPIHAEYLSRLGDLDLARERYQNMTQEHESLLMEQESRSLVGMELHGNLKTFLASLPAKEAVLQGEIVAIELDVERLRSQCLDAGINLDEPGDGSQFANPMETEIDL